MASPGVIQRSLVLTTDSFEAEQPFASLCAEFIFFDIADIISRTNPRAIFLENVENLVSHNKGETLRRIVTTLEDELGYRIIGVTMDEDGSYVYNTKSFIRNSKNFGLPQNRPRTYIMAFSKKNVWGCSKGVNR